MNTSMRHEEMTPATSTAAPPPDAGPTPSTLIEFPRPGRAKPPQWRKDLSERVREIQQRRALEAAREAEDSLLVADAAVHDGAPVAEAADAAPPPLGLVPTPEPPEVNPIVAKALKRIERARHPIPQTTYSQQARAASAQAAARLPEETHQPAPPPPHAAHAGLADAPDAEPHAAAPAEPAVEEEIERTAEPVRTTTLVVVPPPAPPDTEAGAAIREALNRPRPRRHIPEVADDALLLRREAEVAPAVFEQPDPSAADPAPAVRRVVAATVDLLVVAFASSPFAAVIELTSGNWHDPRVAASLGGIVLTILFLYETVSVAFCGRTWGMALFGLRAVDSRTGLIPAAGQCARRALAYILSLAALGLPLLPALFGSEGRAAHDRLSRTAVVKE